ncbi:cell-cycle alteration and expression-elevated protein in tumor domain-containing protein [Ditylenchus destructor]|uniref:Cell-cycle alteration and expression-elevated protein in tumor domain-containing protein n=1 Tax=Ditylenchus destructor TaxID=166010 RepID=A0AAD4NJ31_9BILA|nr:cell-cycle alteration and expression-elevated protein in tumor domain-containing protein [Ditylenchus destructor]
MSGFSEEMMRERLKKLTNTLHSIQTLSLWIIHHQKKHADVILETWVKEVKEQTHPEKIIALVNLANDVIQNCRKKSPAFMKKFLTALEPAFSHIAELDDQKCNKSVLRIISVWKERCIYRPDEIDNLNQCICKKGADSKIKAEFKLFSKITTNLVGVLRKLEDPASADAKVRQLIASYPEAVANPVHLKNLRTGEQAQELMERIEEASPVVNAYCERLKLELQDRRSAQRLLDDYLNALDESTERNKRLIHSVQKRIGRIDQEKKDIEKHIESLPDLSELFSAGPLPSVGELF